MGTRLFQWLFSSLCRPVFGDRVCPLCEREIPSHQNYFDHLNSDQLNNVYGLKVLRNILENGSQSVMDLASCVLYPCQSPSTLIFLHVLNTTIVMCLFCTCYPERAMHVNFELWTILSGPHTAPQQHSPIRATCHLSL